MRHIFFRPTGLPPALRELTPVQLAEGLLEKVFVLLQSDGTADAAQWIEFMTWVSALQAFDFVSLSGLEKVAAFLNVFHCMVIHGMLILGPPASWSRWPSFFNFFSYLISYDFVCISEFEHNILR